MLLSYNASHLQSQKIVIKGVLNIIPQGFQGNIYTFAPGSEIIFFDQNSGITVGFGATLILNSTLAHGCNSMWYSIRATGGRIEVKNGSEIRDAYIGIWASTAGSKITAINSVFKNNIVSIGMGDNVPQLGGSNFSIINDGIYGNTFEGDGSLLGYNQSDPSLTFGFEHSAGAIFIEGINSPINIGVETASSNQILNYQFSNQRGISINNSRVLVENTRFQNVLDDFENFGIFAKSYNATSALQVKGAKLASDPDFKNYRFGIFQQNLANSKLENLLFDRNITGLAVSYDFNPTDPDIPSVTALNINPVNLDVSNCTFKSFRNQAVLVGTETALVSNKIHIYNNQINNDNNLSGLSGGTYRAGIRIGSTLNASINNAYIYDNEFQNGLNISENYFKYGIRLSNINNMNVGENHLFENDYENGFNSGYIGIYAEGAQKTNFYNNSVIGVNTNIVQNINYGGIVTRDSRMSAFNCNSFDKLYNGIFVSGECNDSKLTFNEFNFHGASFEMSSDALIGDQVNGENRWLGQNSFTEAYMGWDAAIYGNYDPINNFSHQEIVRQRGEFKINSPGVNNPADPYFPAPRVIDLIDDDGIWFSINSGSPNANQNVVNCTSSPWPPSRDKSTDIEPVILNTGDQLVFNSAFEIYKGSGWKWDYQFHLFQKLLENPTLRPVNSIANNWFQSQKNTPMGKLSEINTRISQVSQFSISEAISLDNGFQLFDSLLQVGYTLNRNIALAGAPSSTLLTSRASNEGYIEQSALEYQDLVDQFNLNLNLQLDSLHAALNMITVANTSICEQNMKALLHVQLNMLRNRQAMSEQQATEIQSIAAQCRYIGGWAVVMARLMLGDQNPYSDQYGCGTEERNAAVSLALSPKDWAFQPNPASDAIQLKGIPTDQSVILRLFNSLGVLVQQIDPVFPEDTISIRHLTPGLYTIVPVISGQALQPKKLMIVK